MSYKTIKLALLCFSIFFIFQTAYGDVPGDLYVICEKGVSIYVDDAFMGITDENGFAMGMLEGEYVIRAEKEGEVIYSGTFSIQSGETTEISIPVKE